MSKRDENPFRQPLSDAEVRHIGGGAPMSPSETALAMLQKGSTRGMVKIYLRKQGLPEHEIKRIVDSAEKSQKIRARGKGLLSMVAGSILIVICVGLMFIRETVLNHLFLGMIAGGVLFAKGLFSAVFGMDSNEG